MGWVLLRNADTGGKTLVPDDADVLAVFEARGWEKTPLPPEAAPFAVAGDVVAINEIVARQVETERVQTVAEIEELRGKALDKTLKAAGLPTSGTADEKRQRLVEQETGTPTEPEQPTPTEETEAGEVNG